MQKSDKRKSVLMQNTSEARIEARKCIKSAPIFLLKQKKYDEIRMTDIVQKSGISRMGVYNNYKSKDEIMLYLYKKPLEDAFSSLDASISAKFKKLLTAQH